jgi:hypothetical protein
MDGGTTQRGVSMEGQVHRMALLLSSLGGWDMPACNTHQKEEKFINF